MAAIPGCVAPTPKSSTVVSLLPQTTGVPGWSETHICRALRNAADHRGGRDHARQGLHRPIDERAKLGRPGVGTVVGHQGADDIAVVCLPGAGEAETQVILREHQLFRPRRDCRLVALDPGQHGQRPGRIDAVERSLDDGLAGALVQFRGFGCAALVGPQDGRAKHPIRFVEQHRNMRTAADANAANLGFTNAGIEEGLRRCRAERIPPKFRILLRPAEMRNIGLDRVRRFPEQPSIHGDDGGLQAPRAQIDAQKCLSGHGATIVSLQPGRSH